MNKLITTTILASTLVAGSAVAQINADWSGNYTYGLYLVESDMQAGTQSVQQGGDWEIDFKGSFEMDNGITAYVDMEFDAQSNAEGVGTDDIHVGLEGSFGNLMFGKLDAGHSGAGYTPYPALVNGPTTKYGESDTAYTNMDNDDLDAIMYHMPSLSVGRFNLGAGIGYHAGGSGNTTGTNFTNDLNEIVSAGASIGGSFGDTTVKLGMSHSLSMEEDDQVETNVGLSVGFGAFSVTSAYETYTDASSLDKDTIGISGSYSTGPFGFTLAYAQSEQEGATSATDDEITTMAGQVTYAVGPGVSVGLNATATEEDLSGDEGSQVKLYTSINF